jgi:hypothetical protein
LCAADFVLFVSSADRSFARASLLFLAFGNGFIFAFGSLSPSDARTATRDANTRRTLADAQHHSITQQLATYGITPTHHATIVSFAREQASNGALPDFSRGVSDLSLELDDGSRVSLPDMDALNVIRVYCFAVCVVLVAQCVVFLFCCCFAHVKKPTIALSPAPT